MRTKEQYYGYAVLSAFIATLVVALAYLTKQIFDPSLDTDLIYWTSAMFGAPDRPVIGWMAYFVLGSIFGGLIFGWLSPHLFGSVFLRGILFGVLCWLVLMLVGLPMTEAGLFGQKLGNSLLPISFLMLKVVYGGVLGFLYGELIQEQSLPPSERMGGENEDRRRT